MIEKLRSFALEESPVLRLVVDANGVLILANQRARAVFGLDLKDIGRPISDLEVSYRPLELRSLIERAYAERRAVTQANVERRLREDEVQHFEVTLTPLFDEQKHPLGANISFLDVTGYTRLQEELRRSREEIQTATEELQSSNEELEITNEELQSTNEELETMNEELQSTIEELQAVNAELRQRAEELNRSNAFLWAVLGSLRAAAVVVNRDLNVLVWNSRAEDLWGLRQDEVRGKSVLNLDIGLPVGELRAPLRACLQDGSHQELVLQAVNRRGGSIRCRIVCTPLVSAQQRDGVIVMMEESPGALAADPA